MGLHTAGHWLPAVLKLDLQMILEQLKKVKSLEFLFMEGIRRDDSTFEQIMSIFQSFDYKHLQDRKRFNT